jgi:hypothetical protein
MSFSMAMTARATNVVANSIFREASGATVANGLATFADLLGRRCDAFIKAGTLDDTSWLHAQRDRFGLANVACRAHAADCG